MLKLPEICNLASIVALASFYVFPLSVSPAAETYQKRRARLGLALEYAPPDETAVDKASILSHILCRIYLIPTNKTDKPKKRAKQIYEITAASIETLRGGNNVEVEAFLIRHDAAAHNATQSLVSLHSTCRSCASSFSCPIWRRDSFRVQPGRCSYREMRRNNPPSPIGHTRRLLLFLVRSTQQRVTRPVSATNGRRQHNILFTARPAV